MIVFVATSLLGAVVGLIQALTDVEIHKLCYW